MNAHTRMFSSAGHSDGAASSRSIIETGNLARDNAILTEQVRRVEAALDNMSQGLCLFDADSRLVVCNRRYHEIFKLPPGTLTFGLTQREICSILIDNGSYPSSVTLEGIRESTHVALRRSTGTPVLRELADGRTLSVLYRTLPDGGWVSTFEDITQQRLSEARIEHLARHDGLTDLANARTLREESGSLLANVSAEAPILALLYLDLDRFKFVNDTYGHDIGDELLRAVAGRLRAATCRDDRVSRLGGDEFAVMRRVRVPDEALSFARRLIQSISAPYDLSTGKVEVGTSIGVAIRHGAVSDVEPLLQEADFALRHVKATDRGIVSLFDPAMSDAARLRRSLESELHMALAAGQFEVHYQPLIDLDGKRPVGAEALVRWRHPERGLVPPASFIPVAEEIGLIVAIGEWVMRQACHDAMTWPEHMTVAVNVSSFQMRHKTFAGTVLAALSEAHLPPDRLEIEITESALLDESETIMRNLNALRTAGIRFAMDDFGTGYSSLSYLRRFPIDKIKIDKSFMKDAEANSDALAIIRAVAGLGVSLGITTLIEGVETSEQLDLARAEGVRQVQGFLFSRPLPNDIMSPMLKGEMPLSFLETNPPLS